MNVEEIKTPGFWKSRSSVSSHCPNANHRIGTTPRIIRNQRSPVKATSPNARALSFPAPHRMGSEGHRTPSPACPVDTSQRPSSRPGRPLQVPARFSCLDIPERPPNTNIAQPDIPLTRLRWTTSTRSWTSSPVPSQRATGSPSPSSGA